MQPALIAGFLWAVAAAGTAMLPMRWQFAPGLGLLIAAPVLVAWIGWSVAWWAGALMLVAFLSMFRRPLRALGRWARTGEAPERPRDGEEPA